MMISAGTIVSDVLFSSFSRGTADSSGISWGVDRQTVVFSTV